MIKPRMVVVAVALLALVVLRAIPCLAAESVAVSAAVAASIKAKLTAVFPQTTIEQIGPAPLPGLYEVVAGGQIAYTNAAGNLLFTGHIVDVDSQEDLTERRWNALHSIVYGKLPFDRAITVIRGNGAREVAVFEDPLCPYCKRLEDVLAQTTDVKVRVFLYPLEDVHPGARAKAHDIWCSKDRPAAWVGWMASQATPAPEEPCDDKVIDALRQLGQSLGVSATPTLFFADGHRVPGAISAERLEREFAAAARSTQ